MLMRARLKKWRAINLNNNKLFTPYYINQSRLFDLYSILNDGYSEYEEVSASNVSSTKGSGKAEASGSGGLGFKLIKISGNIEGTVEHEKQKASGTTTKRVQTVTSILGSVLSDMHDKKHIIPLEKSKIGDFIEVDLSLTLNSVKHILSQLKDIVELTTSMNSLGAKVQLPFTKKQIDDLMKAFTFLFGGYEVFFETEEYAIIANIIESNLYLSQMYDVIDTEIKCFCQIKNVFPEGTELLRNTIFSKMRSSESKTKFIDAIAAFGENDTINLGASARSEVLGKRVYEVEIISLCK